MMAVNNVADNLGLSTDMASTEKYSLSTCQVLFVCTTHTTSCHAMPYHGPAASGKPHMSQLSWKVMTMQCMKSDVAKAQADLRRLGESTTFMTRCSPLPLRKDSLMVEAWAMT